jgi:hypothetical protein
MTWEQLAGGSAMGCQAGHHDHPTRTVEIVLNGPTLVPDYPPIPHRYACHWSMDVWDHREFMDQPGVYCTAQDETSHSIASQGIWEGYETLAALEILSEGDGVVVDVGAHVGWYTMLAASVGREVVAVESNPENVRLLESNTAGLPVDVVQGWVGVRTQPVTGGPRIRLLKADIEGLEREAVRVFTPLLEEGRIDWVMLELSPEFPGSDVPGIVSALEGFGYRTRLIPEKGTPVEKSVWLASDPVGPLTSQRTLLAGP